MLDTQAHLFLCGVRTVGWSDHRICEGVLHQQCLPVSLWSDLKEVVCVEDSVVWTRCDDQPSVVVVEQLHGYEAVQWCGFFWILMH